MAEDRRGNHLKLLTPYMSDPVLCVRGMRSGTVPHTLAVGLGAACEIAGQEMEVSLVIDLESLQREGMVNIKLMPQYLRRWYLSAHAYDC